MAARVELRAITNEEGNRLLRIVHRDSGSVVTWRRAQIFLLSAQRMSPAKISEVVFTDPDLETKKNRILELYELADAGKATVICLDEFGPLNLQPQPGGKAWAPLKKPRRIRATYTRPHGVRHMLGAYDVTRDRLYGHVKKRKTRTEFLAFCRYVRSLYPAEVRLHFILDNFSPHLGDDVRNWAADNNVELAYTPSMVVT